MLDDHFAFLLFLLCFSRFSCITSMICFKISTAILPRQPLFFPHCSFLSFKYTYSTHWQPKAINSQYAWLVERTSAIHHYTHTSEATISSLSFPRSANYAWWEDVKKLFIEPWAIFFQNYFVSFKLDMQFANFD
jgi:hypothetical protein